MCVGGPPNLLLFFMEALLLPTAHHREYDTTQSDNCISNFSTISVGKDGFVVTRDILPGQSEYERDLGTADSSVPIDGSLQGAGCMQNSVAASETQNYASTAPFILLNSSWNGEEPSNEFQISKSTRTQRSPATPKKTRMESKYWQTLALFQSRRVLGSSAYLTANNALAEDFSVCAEKQVIYAILKQVLSTSLFAVAAILAVLSCLMAVAIPFPDLKQSGAIQMKTRNLTTEVAVSESCWKHPWENRVLGFLAACLCFAGRSWLCDHRYWKRQNGCWRCHDVVECTRNRAKEAEDEARKAQRTKQQFMAYVFHNIRVPFNAIVLGLGHLRATVGKETSGDEVREKMDLVQMMLDCAETMTSVLDDVTDMGQWEDGAMELQLEEFDLLAVVTFLSWGMKDLLYQKKICFTMNVDSVVREVLTANHVVGDKHRVLQTLGNFLSNAVKFTPAGGRLELSISCEEVLQSNAHHCSSKLDIQGSIQSHDCSLCPSLRVEGSKEPSKSHSNAQLIDPFCGQCNVAKLIISVKDTGIGISSEDQLKLFEPYSFVTSGWVQKAGVSGLGLSMAKRFAEQSGGYIGVVSKEGEGSTFYFAIPYPLVPVQDNVEYKVPSKVFCDNYDEQMHQCPKIWDGTLPFKCSNSNVLQERNFHIAMPPLPQKSNSRRVLLVEDTLINRIILRKVLQNLNLHCEEAENGQVAVDFLKQGRTYDLILMDKEMPVMDGHEATRQLRMMGIKTPIVALTGNALQSDRELFFEAGVDDFQTKPLSRDKLVQLLARFGVESSCADQSG